MNEIRDYLGICSAVECVALFGEFTVKVSGVYNVPVVCYSHQVFAGTDYNGLGIANATGACGGITIVTYCDIAGEQTQGLFVKYLRDQTHSGVNLNFLTIGSRYARAFLAAVL